MHTSLVPWPKLQSEWEAGIPVRQLASKYHISRELIYKKIKKEGWKKEKHNEENMFYRWIDVAGELPLTGIDCLQDPVQVATFLNCLSQGATIKIACSITGINYDVYRKWKELDPHFEDVVEQARAVPAMRRLLNIEQAGNRGDWRASLALLERDEGTRKDFRDPKSRDGAGGGGKLEILVNVPRGDDIRGQRLVEGRIVDQEDGQGDDQ